MTKSNCKLKSLGLIPKLLISTLLIQSAVSLGQDDKCRVLALRGGGTKGAYESGALKGLFTELKNNSIDFSYDVVSGVSIGAINAALIALYPKGQEMDAINELEQIWRTHQVQDLYRNWPGQPIIGSLWKDAIFDNTPLQEFGNQTLFGRTFHRKITYQSKSLQNAQINHNQYFDMNTGRVVNFDEQTPVDQMYQSLLASASIPGVFILLYNLFLMNYKFSVFSPQHLKNMVLADGGVFENLNLGPAVNKCREQGVPDNKIIVDVLLCFHKCYIQMGLYTDFPYNDTLLILFKYFDGPIQVEEWTYEEAKYKSVSELQKRKQELRDSYYYLEDVDRVIRGFPEVQYRYVLQPSEKLPTKFIPIFSSLDETVFQLELGAKDMTNLVRSGKQVYNNSIDFEIYKKNYIILQQTQQQN